MKHSGKFVLASLFFANYSAFAVTPADGWYWGLMGGFSYTPSVSVRGPNPAPFIMINDQINPNPVPVVANNPFVSYATRLPITSPNSLLNYPIDKFLLNST